ncbi:hypothetical protein RM530_09490 [Algiphilus sp. W345]|uniref:Uncharacterized protein n=1 Tax=Banduia mediterranea TaxID=3075609 RepID=A0ABU2WJ68_9GAMM|nr:hypothetical protein [Algiphilus sp. W345]MDT0497593.1 hypothetical protein [Algiphilus sp. W345]
MSDSTPVTFGALARQSLRILPEWPQLRRGARNLATLSRDQHRSVGARLASLARSQPQRPFLRFEDRAWTYAEFARLPKYAVPLFIRLRTEQEVTSTFKYRKVDLKRQGFDPAEVGEPLNALFDRERGYEPLDGAAHIGILQPPGTTAPGLIGKAPQSKQSPRFV